MMDLCDNKHTQMWEVALVPTSSHLERNGSSLSKQIVPNIKESTRSGIALQGIDREGNFFLEACDTTKAQSKAIAKQIAILAAVKISNTIGVLKYHPPHQQ